MAANKKAREVKFVITNEDYRAFGRYRIMYTDQGRKMVRRMKLTYVASGIIVALLFTIFHVDPNFTKLMYVVSAAMVVAGIFFGEKMVLSQQDKAIEKDKNSAERVYAAENTISFGEDSFTTSGGGDEQHFTYKDIKQIDLTEEAIYVWMSDTMIMPVPLHAFKNMEEMKDLYKWLKVKVEENGGKAGV